ncbi:MAG: hypothetical protein DMG06_31030, partial [Acidobacteria bacterium]
MKTKFFFLLLLSLVLHSQARISIPRPDAVTDVAKPKAALMTLPGSSAIPSFNTPTKASKGLAASYGQLPLSFEANQGQTDPQVQFLSRSSGYTLFLTKTEAVIQLRVGDRRLRKASTQLSIDDFRLPLLDSGSKLRTRFTDSYSEASDSPLFQGGNTKGVSGSPSSVVRMKLVGANPKAQIKGIEKLPSITNYFIGNDAKQWRTRIPNYAQVQYKGVFPGIDLTYYGNQRQLEYDFVVSAGADPGLIKISYEGTQDIRISETGDLIINVAGMKIHQHKPRIYQEIEGARREVAGNYVLKGKNLVGFHLEEYDVSQSLVIDPVLSYSIPTDLIGRIAMDTSGNLVLSGRVDLLLPTTPGAYLESIPASGFGQAFVAKINATGSALVYCSYLGGTDGGSGASGVAIDRFGNAYVTGGTGASDFPLVNPLQTVRKGDSTDFFVVKLNADGSNLIYSTYLGGSK